MEGWPSSCIQLGINARICWSSHSANKTALFETRECGWKQQSCANQTKKMTHIKAASLSFLWAYLHEHWWSSLPSVASWSESQGYTTSLMTLWLSPSRHQCCALSPSLHYTRNSKLPTRGSVINSLMQNMYLK